MDKFVYFVAVFAILCLNASVIAIECLQGGRVVQNGVEVNTFQNLDCIDDSLICSRIAFTLTGVDGGNSKFFWKTISRLFDHRKLLSSCKAVSMQRRSQEVSTGVPPNRNVLSHC